MCKVVVVEVVKSIPRMDDDDDESGDGTNEWAKCESREGETSSRRRRAVDAIVVARWGYGHNMAMITSALA